MPEVVNFFTDAFVDSLENEIRKEGSLSQGVGKFPLSSLIHGGGKGTLSNAIRSLILLS